jgi:hypothetical protein
VRTNENKSDRKKIAKKATVNDPPRPVNHEQRRAALLPVLQQHHGGGSELTGSVYMRLRFRVLGNLTGQRNELQSLV